MLFIRYLFGCLLVTFGGYAQTPVEVSTKLGVGADIAVKIKQRLDQQLANYQLLIKDLVESRGVVWTDARQLRREVVTAALHDYDGADRTALLFYHVEADTLYSYLFSGKGVVAHVSRPVIGSVDLVKHLTRPIPSTNGRGGKVGGNNHDRLTLSQYLLPSTIAAALKTDTFDQLLIAPEGNIATLPFALLTPFGGDTLLIERMPIAIVPSLSALLEKIHYYNKILPEIGPATFDPLQPLIVGAPEYKGKCMPSLAPLPHTAREAQTIADLFGSRPLLGKSATSQAVEKAMPTADFIHIATHGFSSSSQSLESSYLALTSTPTRCGLWTARTIQRQKLSGEALVVLSACETGQGQVHDGGIIGLARAFQLAGASNVVMSLWPVPDQSTADLMIQFVQELRRPASFFPAGHLRQIMLSQKKSGVSSNTWAAFTCFGVPYPPRLQMGLKKG